MTDKLNKSGTRQGMHPNSQKFFAIRERVKAINTAPAIPMSKRHKEHEAIKHEMRAIELGLDGAGHVRHIDPCEFPRIQAEYEANLAHKERRGPYVKHSKAPRKATHISISANFTVSPVARSQAALKQVAEA